MKLLFSGAIIKRERLARNWSQEGLCRGICAVSYLSKIEQGKTESSPEILRMLFARLKIRWYDDAPSMDAVKSLTKRCYEALLSGDREALAQLREEFSDQETIISYSPYALDGALLHGLLCTPCEPAAKELEPFFDRQGLALQRMIQGRHEEAIRLYPCAYISLRAGIECYERGKNDAALEYLLRAYDMAAEEGYVRIMLSARVYMGNCYCNRIDIENMNKQYRIAGRLAQTLGDDEALWTIQYNRASTYLEAGDYNEAYVFFSRIGQPSMMELHKLAICCEKLGLRSEALCALDKASQMEEQYPERQLSKQMCSLVRFRLEHEDYLQCSRYGEQLLRIFQQCRRELPIGYAAFHLPWVLEWYTASRQYRAAFELLQDFPLKLPLKHS